MYILKKSRFDGNEKTSTFTATHGVISGELELRTTCQEDGTLELKITYIGAIDVYTLPR
ncbi:hypothetical protein [Exiguobacterium undae]|uniref:hypothetical protein n=1 Tax=Exiguobacterium undae TaxID=169177 RepID=UPI000A9F99F1|nr:hypothetical protein [Exiguobacterium undae]